MRSASVKLSVSARAAAEQRSGTAVAADLRKLVTVNWEKSVFFASHGLFWRWRRQRASELA